MFLYKKFSDLLGEYFDERVQKISVNAGFTCPNRDGSKGLGGCIYCNNSSFSPPYCVDTKDVGKQIERGIDFFKKYKSQKYIVYFQSYTNTYGDFEHLKQLYTKALQSSRVVGLSIGTRPDCVNEQLLDFLGDLSKKYFVMVEYGVESTNNKTLNKINRGHSFEQSQWAIKETSKRNILTGAHIILGMPYETEQEQILQAQELSKLPIDMLKIHQLQVVKNTKLHDIFVERPAEVPIFSIDSYLSVLIEFIEQLRPNIALDRFVSQAPQQLVVAPNWNIKNFEFVHKLEKLMKEKHSFQGKKYLQM